MNEPRQIASATHLIDVHFLGHPDYIGCYVLTSEAGVTLIDPGPTSTLVELRTGLDQLGIDVRDVRWLLLTHIHLDHAAASGSLVRLNPSMRVYVHSRGARHMIDPDRLIASATRLYGDQMDTMWGEFLPVPEANVVALDGGETLEIAGRWLQVAYTPGHASHHVSYFDDSTQHAYIGDTAGIRIDNRPRVMPVTPPPDIDLGAWPKSIEAIRSWNPSVLCPTHFGPAHPVDDHLDEHEARLRRWAAIVRADVDDSDSAGDAFSAERFDSEERSRLVRALGEEDGAHYLRGGGLSDSWFGLARHFRKLAEQRSDGPRD